MELGGNIELIGFEGIEPGMFVIVKKMVGNYAKNTDNMDKLLLSLEKTDDSFKLTCKLVVQGKEHTGESTSSNIFFGIDEAIKNAKKE